MTSAELRDRAAQARREHRREDACRDVQQAVAQARAGSDPAELAISLAALGQLERDDGNLVRAMAHYEEAIAIHLDRGNQLALAHAMRHLGDVHRENDCPEMAGLCYQEALAIYVEHPATPPLDFANALRSFAIHKQHCREERAAVRLWQAARDLYASLGMEAGVRECDHRLVISRQLRAPKNLPSS